MSIMKRLLSGIQPSGELHLGNYLGAIKQWAEYQNDYDAFFMIADYHALTGKPSAEELQKRSLDLVAMLVACGIDPKHSTLFLQSQVSEHTELGWILSNFTTLGQLNRMTQFKEKSNQHDQNVGLYTYPILQAADIALYQAQAVPVGDDQVQHLELSREIIRSFNNHVSDPILTEPKPLLNKAARIMALNDPTKKMSKSVEGSAIGLLSTPNEVTRLIKRAVTDSDANATELSAGLKNLFVILEDVASHETFHNFEQMRRDGKLHYSELKEQLIEDINHLLGPIQKTYVSLRADEKTLHQILAEGCAKAEPVAAETLQKAKKALGLILN